MEIHVIRHTRLKAGLNKCYGQTEIPVAESFKDDASEIKKQLKPPYDAIFCSPLKRCQMLAKELNFSEIKLEPALKEISFGSWENQNWDDINREQLDKWCNDFVNETPPDGENLRDFYSRIIKFITDLKSENYKKVLLITHAGVIRCIHAYFNNVALDKLFDIPVGFNEVFAFDL
ncbi:MAG: alpha-ribazole phosphatase [Lentimicrobiaceae bacterium]|nr:alpha-ribazole phosphatase [Lentimicrobiaceae bacterium]